MKTFLEWLELIEDHWLVELIGGLLFFSSLFGLMFLLLIIYPSAYY
tara:strand:+ start:253 stop:390 length:138 start_codon:yes stop_codon:yes gene_type:complete